MAISFYVAPVFNFYSVHDTNRLAVSLPLDRGLLCVGKWIEMHAEETPCIDRGFLLPKEFDTFYNRRAYLARTSRSIEMGSNSNFNKKLPFLMFRRSFLSVGAKHGHV